MPRPPAILNMILEVLEEFKRPMTISEIHATLKAQGRSVHEESVRRTLHRETSKEKRKVRIQSWEHAGFAVSGVFCRYEIGSEANAPRRKKERPPKKKPGGQRRLDVSPEERERRDRTNARRQAKRKALALEIKLAGRRGFSRWEVGL